MVVTQGKEYSHGTPLRVMQNLNAFVILKSIPCSFLSCWIIIVFETALYIIVNLAYCILLLLKDLHFIAMHNVMYNYLLSSSKLSLNIGQLLLRKSSLHLFFLRLLCNKMKVLFSFYLALYCFGLELYLWINSLFSNTTDR